jgi:8-oxo-dGTP diphosphatase
LNVARKKARYAFLHTAWRQTGDGESIEEALSRETQRGARQRLAESEFVGTFVAPVANETARALEAALSHAEIALDVKPDVRNRKDCWVKAPREENLFLAPLTKTQVLSSNPKARVNESSVHRDPQGRCRQP